MVVGPDLERELIRLQQQEQQLIGEIKRARQGPPQSLCCFISYSPTSWCFRACGPQLAQRGQTDAAKTMAKVGPPYTSIAFAVALLLCAF